VTPALSLRLRLTLLWCLSSLIVLLALEMLTFGVLSAQLTDGVDRELALEARQYQAKVAGAPTELELQQRAQAFIADNTDVGHGPAAAYWIKFADGSVLTNTQDGALQATIASARPPSGRPVTVSDPGRGDLRVASISIQEGGRPIGDLRIAIPVGSGAILRNLLTPLVFANAAIIGLGGLLAYLVIGGALAPIRRISSTAAGISEGDLSRRIGHRGPRDEVGQLAETFDAMLGRLQNGFEQRQAFYALASHELRTPITIVRGHLEVLRRTEQPDPEEVRETLEIALEELGRMTAEVNDMLLLGRMLLGQPGELQPLDAGSVLIEVYRRARGLAVRDWQVQVDEPAPIRANPEHLRRALLNLVTNAVHHTDEGNRIRLGCRSSGEWVLIEVADSGDGINAADLPHVFAPWYRAGEQEGSVGGLGLMIVREVARAHGGDVDVVSSKQSGTTFIIRLPRIVDEALPEVGTVAEPHVSQATG